MNSTVILDSHVKPKKSESRTFITMYSKDFSYNQTSSTKLPKNDILLSTKDISRSKTSSVVLLYHPETAVKAWHDECGPF
ncbi:hypothetical protein ABEV00_07020 [Paenibacillus thiaminolyticus]|uniref:hypothetical protein n=1 Tax=Paenibacillus thiaminolyticus TaxID=49283 RepID=UPI003D2E2129